MLNLFTTVVNMSVTASLIIGVVALARLALKKAPKIFSYALWWVVLLRLLCPAALPLSLPQTPETSAPAAQTVSSPQETGEPVSDVLPLSESEENEIPVQIIPGEILPKQQIRSIPQDILSYAVYFWLTGAASMMLLGIASALRFRRHLRGSCRLRDNVYLTDHLESAFVVGLFSPKIYLPSDLPRSQIRYIAAHEQHHIARLDHVVKHLFYFALCLHWFNPLVWIAFSLMGRDMEMSCDEAVMKKLGSHIRAEYSASLLQLATGHRIVAGSPLCFGEGDAKGRIRNLARWKQPKKWQSLFCLALCAVMLTACAASPLRQVIKPQGLPAATTDGAETLSASYQAVFQDARGTTTYHIDIAPGTVSPIPSSVEAFPRPITGEDMERVARALLGDAPFYEKEPSSNPQYSRQQYQQMLNRWESYLSSGEMTSLFGVNQGPDRLEALKQNIEIVGKALITAPEENPLTPCDWTLKKERVYNDQPWEIYDRPLSEDGDWLVATAEKDGLGYTYMVIQDDLDDYRLRRYLIQLGGASLYPSMDRKLAWAKLCRTEPPTDQQIRDVQSKVLGLLARMDFGQWAISSAQVEVDSTVSPYEYKVRVIAVPMICDGIPVIQDHMVTEGSADGAASAYLPTQAKFLMSANGDLLDMELDTPVEIREVTNGTLAPLSFEKLMELTRQTLIDTEQSPVYRNGEPYPEPLLCNAYIRQVSYAMTSSTEQTGTESFFYTPCFLLHGDVEFYGADSGKVYDTQPHTFVCLDAVDGRERFGY